METFPGLQDLNFGEPITGQFIAEVCRYWIDTFGIDGIRLDNTVNYHVPGDLRGLPEILVRRRAAHIADQGEENFSLTLEHIDISAATVTNDTGCHQLLGRLPLSEDQDLRRAVERTDRQLLPQRAQQPPISLSAGKVPTLYLSNHDHSHVAWRTGAREGVGAVGTVVAAPALPDRPVHLHGGAPDPQRRRVRRGNRHPGERPRHRAAGHRTPVALEAPRRPDRHQALTALHGRLARLRRDHPALRSPSMYPHEWETWQTQFQPCRCRRRRRAPARDLPPLGVACRAASRTSLSCSTSPTLEQAVEVPFPVPGRWTDRLSTFAGGPEWAVDVAGSTTTVPVGSHFGRIFHRFNP